MCNACGFPTRPGHWTDAGATTSGDRLRLQLRRVEVLNKILRGYGFSARTPGHGPGFALASFTGRTTLLPDLETVWEEAAQQLGQPLDPLDPRFTGSGTSS
ncbi:hypothetical protein [Sulfitobacter sp.]|uniref:hypothetical protein n=1 Tax=Sulfitobacter sp. TaxID=1903071 RepID=UPI0030037337